MIERKPLVSFVACLRLRWPVRTCVCGGRTGLICAHELRGREAGLGGDVDLVELALLVEQTLRGREVEDRQRRAAERGRRRRSRRCRRCGRCCSAPRAITPIVSPTLKCLLLGGVRVDRDLVGPDGQRAGDERERVEALVAVRVDAEAEAGGAARRDHLAVAPDELRTIGDRALRFGDAGQLAYAAPAASPGTTARRVSRRFLRRRRSCR